MKKSRNPRFATLLFSLLLLLSTISSPTSLCAHASKLGQAAHENHVAEYQPSKKKVWIGRVLDWGLAKVENAFDAKLVSDLISAFIVKCDHLFTIMVHSLKEIFIPYGRLHETEVERLDQFDKEFSDLVNLRNKIDRKCLYSTGVEDRSLCVDKGIEIHDKIRKLRTRRDNSAAAIVRYEGWIDWCGVNKNWSWFC